MVKGKLALRLFASPADNSRARTFARAGGSIAATAVEGFSRRQTVRLN